MMLMVLKVPILSYINTWQIFLDGLIQNFTDVIKSNFSFSEVLKVNFELGNEVWDDFDDENLIEITSFSAETEKTKPSGK